MVMALLFAGCGSGGAFAKLPTTAQEQLERCWPSMQASVCGSKEGSGGGSEACKEHAQTDFASRKSDDQRRDYLSENACSK
jgi:hypothetical protein